eukprot:scaffold5048_cov121-Cylindrotheca_fusiformis.AAC.10
MSVDLDNCKAVSVDFIVSDGDVEMLVVEDDIRRNLEAIGITVNTLFLNDTEYRDAELNGDYNLLFTRTWGAPYDPHSYLTSWAVPSHVEYSAIQNLQPPLTREELLQKIERVQAELEPQVIQAMWKEILEDVHKQALFLPLWGTRVPYVINRRLMGFTPGETPWSFPLNSLQVAEGSSTVRLVPGLGGLFKGVGPLHPHLYAPNELYAQGWIYEGLVSYGQDGEIVPALATSWNTEATASGQRVTFQLRGNVTFHDGTAFNCAAAKLNFDHVLSDTVAERHQWFGAATHLKSWVCNDADEFVLETDTPFYPLLQELSFIRPLRFASPAVFADGIDSHPEDKNSCEPGMFGSGWDHLEDTVNCAGLSEPIGTGPLKYVSRETLEDGTDAKVTFARNDDYWGQVPGFETLELIQYDSTDAIEDALMSGDLDMTLGLGPLSPTQVQEIKFQHSDKFDVRHSEVLQHALLVFNGNRAPTNDIEVRRAITHAIDKATFLENEFAGLEQPVTQLLPRTAPYCNVDLSPKWGYDIEKAMLMNCPIKQNVTVIENNTLSGGSDDLSSGAIAGIVIGVLVVVVLIGLVVKMIARERSGKPMFAKSEQAVGA